MELRQKAPPNRRKLDQLFVSQVKADGKRTHYWDTLQRGFGLAVEPSGNKSYKVLYRHCGKLRWYTIDFGIGLKEARKFASKKLLEVANGIDPQAEKIRERRELQDAGTLRELAERYVEDHAKKKNKSWKQAEKLVQMYLLPHLGKRRPDTIQRKDMKRVFRKLTNENGPVLANQVIASASAIFSWAIEEEEVKLDLNPCFRLSNKTRARERVLTDSELPLFWDAVDDAGLVASNALKVLLLTGQRPGEVRNMRREHIVDRHWWVMPGEPDEALGWPGTKNKITHEVWLTDAVLEILEELDEKAGTGFAFPGSRGGTPIASSTLAVAMRKWSEKDKLRENATPHDLRRTHGTTVVGLGFSSEMMNRLQNHKEGGITSVYNRHSYRPEKQRIQEAVSARVLDLAYGCEAVSNVVILSG